ncbi:helix-turn-helix domain-containing protein [Nocardiopsis valliformis]|uniref:helix-turn-helix domain-containing protein n=1 Tax=Nocardiopsis valliformis TaxID=239974 RepID=UPI00034670E3|nr:helix-turn-helix transcriptional regulator [Nocardiopsis valliformis]
MALEPEELAAASEDLGQTLRELRRAAGLSGERLARRCAMSQSKISKIETGRLTPALVDLDRILSALQVTPEQAGLLLTRARLANTEWQGKRELWRKGLETRQDELRSLESSASEARYFLPTMVTGLLATPAYIRASLTHSPGDVSGTVAKKIARQEVLRDGSCSFTFLLTEQAVRWAILPAEGMAEQADHLVAVSRLESVRLGVLPLGTVLPRGPMNTFTVYDDRLATVEIFTGRLAFRDPRDVEMYRELFAIYEEHALFGNAAREQIQAWAAP